MNVPIFDRRMLDGLVCPLTQTNLEYDAQAQELLSRRAKLAFPIRNGIPVMLVDEARDNLVGNLIDHRQEVI